MRVCVQSGSLDGRAIKFGKAIRNEQQNNSDNFIFMLPAVRDGRKVQLTTNAPRVRTGRQADQTHSAIIIQNVWSVCIGRNGSSDIMWPANML